MARKEWDLLFNLSAKQNSSFSSTFKAAQSALVETQGKIQLLNKVQSDISAYQKQQQAVDATRQRLSVLQQQYDNIQKEIQETEGYSSALENKLISKQAQIDKTAASLNTYEQRLAATGNALHEAGVDTTQLTAESVRLETEVDKLKDQQVDLKKTMDEAGEGAKGFGEKSVEALETVEATLATVGISKALGEIRDAYMLNEFVEKILVHERARKGSQDTTQEIEIYFNFLGRYIPPSLQPVPLTPEEQEELQKKEERKDRLHQNYLKRKASGAQKRYEDKIKAKKKAEMDAKKALIRAEDMKKGVFSTVGQLPKEEPRKGSIAASAAV